MRKYYKYKKYVKNKKEISRLKFILILVAFLIALGLGYSLLSDILTIQGSAVLGTYSVTYHLNGGENPENAVQRFEAFDNIALPLPTYTGYTFDGWFENEYYSGSPISSTPTGNDARNIEIYAKWISNDGTMVAQVGETQFATMHDAIHAVPKDGTQTTVILLKDIIIESKIEIESTQNVLFDLQNYSISNSGSINLIENYGTVEIYNGTFHSNAQQGIINNNEGATILIRGGRFEMYSGRQVLYNAGTATITGSADMYSTSNQRGTVQNLQTGVMTITGGTIVATRFFAIDNAGTLTIGEKGGTVSISNPVIQGSSYGVSTILTDLETVPEFNFYDGVIKYVNGLYNEEKVALGEREPGYELYTSTEKIGNVVYTIAANANYMTVTFDPDGGELNELSRNVITGNQLGSLPTPLKSGFVFDGWFTLDGTQITESYVAGDDDIDVIAHWSRASYAKIGDRYYDSLRQAINNVPDNTETTVELLRDTQEKINITSKNKKIILNLQNHTITNLDNSAVIENAGRLTLMNGTITTNSINTAALNNTGTLYITDGMVISATGDRQALYNNGGTTEISGTARLTATAAARATVHNLNKGTMRILGGTIISVNQEAVLNAQGTVTVGTQDGNVDTSLPLLQGKTYGFNNSGTFKFYDGLLKGITKAINGNITELETGYHKQDGTDGSYKTAILVAD